MRRGKEGMRKSSQNEQVHSLQNVDTWYFISTEMTLIMIGVNGCIRVFNRRQKCCEFSGLFKRNTYLTDEKGIVMVLICWSGKRCWKWRKGCCPTFLSDHPCKGGWACPHSLCQVGNNTFWSLMLLDLSASRIVVLGDRGVGKTSIVQVCIVFFSQRKPAKSQNFLLIYMNSPLLYYKWGWLFYLEAGE